MELILTFSGFSLMRWWVDIYFPSLFNSLLLEGRLIDGRVLITSTNQTFGSLNSTNLKNAHFEFENARLEFLFNFMQINGSVMKAPTYFSSGSIPCPAGEYLPLSHSWFLNILVDSHWILMSYPYWLSMICIRLY